MNEPGAAADRLWIRGVNWLGDSVMALPAVAAYRAAHPAAEIWMGVPAGLAAFWALCPALNGVTPLRRGWAGERAAARAVRRLAPDRVVIFPKSFRAAWAPFLARARERIGPPGHFRDFLLTRVVRPPADGHQALGYFELLGLPRPAAAPDPAGLLRIPDEACARAQALIDSAAAGLDRFPAAGGEWLAVAPGAARGGSKRWPAERFAAAAAAVAAARGCGVVVVGNAAEREIGARIAAALPGAALNLAGRTSLAELAAVLARCRATLCNDSGSMHLSAAVGTPVAAVFGLTDPARTGPLGRGHAVLAAPAARRDEKIDRESDRARAALEAVTPAAAADALIRLLARKRD